jgi:hypothetical protein
MYGAKNMTGKKKKYQKELTWDEPERACRRGWRGSEIQELGIRRVS